MPTTMLHAVGWLGVGGGEQTALRRLFVVGTLRCFISGANARSGTFAGDSKCAKQHRNKTLILVLFGAVENCW